MRQLAVEWRLESHACARIFTIRQALLWVKRTQPRSPIMAGPPRGGGAWLSAHLSDGSGTCMVRRLGARREHSRRPTGRPRNAGRRTAGAELSSPLIIISPFTFFPPSGIMAGAGAPAVPRARRERVQRWRAPAPPRRILPSGLSLFRRVGA
jgi:hypothetical protein